MNKLDGFQRQMRQLRERRESEITARREYRRATMDEEARRYSRFKSLAERLCRDVIEPRLAVVAREFPDAAYSVDAQTSTAILRLNTDGRYLARVDICFGVALAGNDSVAVYSRPAIIPILMKVPPEDRILVPLDAIDATPAAEFVEGQLNRFLAAYFALDGIEAYRQSVRVVDPVCGMEISRVDAVESARYMGTTYYFCVPNCRDRFLADPSRYV